MIGIGKTIKGSSKGLGYIQNDKGQAILIEKNNIISDRPKVQFWEMKHVSDLNKFTSNKCYSAVLSPEKEVTKDWNIEDWRKLSSRFAEKMNLQENQYVSTLHLSTGQPHLHIYANRVNYKGENTIQAHDIDKLTQRVAEEISKEMGLKTAKEISQEKGKRSTQEKENIRKDLIQGIRNSRSYNELSDFMSNKGYDLRMNERNGAIIGLRIVNVEQHNKEIQEKRENGIKPTYKESSYKLSEIDRTIKVNDISSQFELNKEINITRSKGLSR